MSRKSLKMNVSAENVVIVILIIVLIVLAVLYLTNNKEGFSAVAEDNRDVLMFFYADWCGYCKRFKPEFEAVKSHIEQNLSDRVRVEPVNCSKPGKNERQLMSEYGVQGFPTLLFINNNNRVEVSSRNSTEIIQLINNNLQ
jgi:thiol:disulfide interchange protein